MSIMFGLLAGGFDGDRRGAVLRRNVFGIFIRKNVEDQADGAYDSGPPENPASK
jgi:hypothetical protein